MLRLVLVGDDDPRHDIRVGVTAAAVAVRARPEAHRPPVLGAVDGGSVGQVAVELALKAIATAVAAADGSWKPGDERLITVADATRCSAGCP